MKKTMILAAVVLVAVAALFALSQGQKTTGMVLQAGGAQESTGQNSESLLLAQRAAYGLSAGVFSELPEPPEDFNMIVSLYQAEKFRDDFFFSEKYYMQPEFYPGFAENGLPYWLNPSTTHWAAYGYGSFPARKNISLKAGDSTRVRFFIHSGFGVQTFQGMQLKAVFSDAGADEFLDASVREPAFALGPSFPKFSSEWARGAIIDVRAASDAPAGSYALEVSVQSPPAELSRKWGSEVTGRYVNAAAVSIGRPVFELAVNVE